MGLKQLTTMSALVEWIPYVRGARNATEQNLEAVLLDARLYYRSVRRVASGEELRVWYTAELATTVGVPDIHPAFISGEFSEWSVPGVGRFNASSVPADGRFSVGQYLMMVDEVLVNT